jgi:hypothetical protein
MGSQGAIRSTFPLGALEPLDHSKGVDFENLFAIGVVK